MPRTLLIQHSSAAGRAQVTLDRDTTLITALGSLCTISTDPNMTEAVAEADGIYDNLICYLYNSSVFLKLSWPLLKGDVIYFDTAVGGWAQLFFQDTDSQLSV